MGISRIEVEIPFFSGGEGVFVEGKENSWVGYSIISKNGYIR